MADPFLQALAEDAQDLDPVVQAFHNQIGVDYRGRCDVERGASLFARLACRIAGFPPSGQDVAVQVKTHRNGDWVTWTRRFGRHTTQSHLRFDENRGLLERFGLVRLTLTVRNDLGALCVGVQSAKFLGLPLPAGVTPISRSSERGDEQGRFRFDIDARLPSGALLVRYSGWLRPMAENGMG